MRDIATPLGVRSSLCVGATTPSSASGAWIDEQRQVAPSVVIGTPAKINELFSGGKSGRGLSGDGVRFLVIDEVDQLIARNLYEFVVSTHIRSRPCLAPTLNLQTFCTGSRSD